MSLNKWPNKTKQYFAILTEDWKKRGISVEEGILELFGRNPNIGKAQMNGVFEQSSKKDVFLSKPELSEAPTENAILIFDIISGAGFEDKDIEAFTQTIEYLTKNCTEINTNLTKQKYTGEYSQVCDFLDIINKDKIGGDNQYDKFITIWNNIKLIYSRLNLDLFDIITTEQFVLNKIQYIKDKIVSIKDITNEKLFNLINSLFAAEESEKDKTEIKNVIVDILYETYNKILKELTNYCETIKTENKVEIIPDDMQEKFKQICTELVSKLLNEFVNLSSKLESKSWVSFTGKTIGKVQYGMELFKEISNELK